MKNRLFPIVSILAVSVAMTLPASAQQSGATEAPMAAVVSAKPVSAAESMAKVRSMLGSLQSNVTSTMAALNNVKKVAKDKQSLAAPYADFVAQYKNLEAELNAVRQQTADSKANTEAYFQTWQNTIASIQNKDIKETATDRFNNAKSRYSKLLATADESRQKIQPFMVDLRDMQAVMNVDLTADLVNSLSNTTWKLGRNAEILVDAIADVNKDIGIVLESLPKN